MTCDQVDELLGAYALDALEADERAALEAHLATCARHGEAAALRATALSLGTLVAEREPSADLEARLMASIGAGDSAGRGAATGGGAPVPLRGPRAARSAYLRWPAAAAAAVVIALVGVAGGFLLAGALEESPTVVQVYRSGDAWMRVERVGDASVVQVTMAGLERRPAGEAYQLWAVRDGRWLPVGTCNTDEDDWWHGDFDFALEPEDRLVLTVEPEDGSQRPTGAPVLGAPPAEG